MQIVMFDVDGVIINGWHYLPEKRILWYENIEQDLGIKKSDAELFINDYIGKADLGKETSLSVLDRCLKAGGYSIPAKDVIEYWLRQDSKTDMEILDKIEKIKNSGKADLYLATNQSDERADYLMNNLGFNRFFKDIFHSARIGYTKTYQEYYDKVNFLLGYPDTPPIFFDDNPDVVSAALQSGWNAYLYTGIETLYRNDFIKSLLHTEG